MAASLHFLVFCSLLLTPLTSAKTAQGPAALVLPVTKDLATLQYVTEIRSTSPNHSPTKLVVDLGGRLIWVDYETGRFSSVYRTVERRSIQCSAATAGSTSLAPGCKENTCSSVTDNTITGLSIGGKIAEDVISIPSIEGFIISMVDSFLLSHVPTFLLQGLASGARGMAGLGRGRIGLPSQLAGSLGLDRKFTVCLPSSSKGFVVFGKNNVTSNSLMYTPLITNDSSVSHEYYIGVKSIMIDGKRLSLNKSLLSKDNEGIGGTKVSTVVPYTTFERSIYFSVTEAFIEASVLLNMTRVTPVAPFDVCFSSRNIAKTELEPAVPVIDLVLQSELVKWRIHWASSMVRVSEDVMCLGFLDGGLRPRTSIVIGGHQLENNLLDFDLASLRIGFESLLNRNTDCSSYIFHTELIRSS